MQVGEIVDLRTEPNEDLLRAFYDELYLPAFPAPEHREELDVWLRDLGEARDSSPSHRYLLIAGSDLRDPSRRRLSGGHMFEYYPTSRCALLSYIVVADESRRQGLGRRLVDEAIDMLSGAAAQDGGEPGLRAVFAECIDPRRAGPEQVAEAWLRLEILGRLGARVLDVPYAPPPLGPGLERAHDLLLLYLPLDADDSGPLPRSVLFDFLREFYAALGVPDPDSDPDFRVASAAVHDDPVPTVEVRQERPSVKLSAVSIALHFVRTEARKQAAPDEPDRPGLFTSIERDLVSYAYRRSPPFASEALKRPLVVEVAYPSHTEVQSEGSTIILRAGGGDGQELGHRRRLRVARSRTVFADGVVVDHVVMTNLGLEGDPLDEYDVVKLLKLHGGGDDSDVRSQLRFSNGHGDVTFSAWLGQVPSFADGSPLHEGQLRAATVLITTGEEEEWNPVYQLVCRLPDEPDEVAAEFRTLMEADDGDGRVSAHRLKASEGIVCSLLNFTAIDHWELADALEPALGSPEYLIWLQKANLVCLAKSDRITSVPTIQRDIGISPYLLAPHAVLIHNEEVLNSASETLRRHYSGQSKSSPEDVRADVIGNLRSDLLPNIFHYRTERLIFDAGERDRGLRELASAVERRVTQLDGEIAARVNAAQVRQERALAIIFGLLSATALGDILVLAFSDAPRWQLAAHGAAFVVVLVIVTLAAWRLGRK